MRAEEIKQGDEIIKLPFPIGTPVFIVRDNQHDGPDINLVEYSVRNISDDVFATRKDAAEFVKNSCKY